MNQANPNSDGPAAISARLSTTHNQHPNNNTDLLQPDSPTGRAGGKVDPLSGRATYEILLRALVDAAAAVYAQAPSSSD